MWRNYGLSITLAALFVVSWMGQTVVGWQEYVQEEAAHGTAAQIGDYVWVWARATLENWQSEFLQLLTFVVLTSFLIHRGSHESKDSSDRLERKVDEIRRSLQVDERLEAIRDELANHNDRIQDLEAR